jgi:hypothetical protein
MFIPLRIRDAGGIASRTILKFEFGIGQWIM